jgi:hypothetical protein
VTLAQALARSIERQHQTVASRVGAGQPLSKAHQVERWARELASDAGASPGEASRFVEMLHSELAKAIGPIQDVGKRVAVVHTLFDFYAARTKSSGLSAQAQVGDHMLYKLYDRHEVLLYVGITDRGPVRLAEHHRRKPWFAQVCRVEFERYQTRELSEEREKRLITDLAPLYNIQHNRGRQIA